MYASRARNIGSSITRNVMNSDAHLNNYVALIGNLKRENEELKKQIKSNSIIDDIKSTNLCRS